MKAVEFKDAKQIIKEEKSEVVSSMETQTELELGVVKSEETKRLPEVKVKTRFVERIKNLKPAQKPIAKDVEVKTEKRVDVETRLESRHISLEYSVSDDHLLDDEEVKQGGQGE